MTKTWKRSATFIEVATAADASAGSVDINIASGSAPTDDFYFIGQVRRADVDIPGFEFEYASGTGMMAVKSAGSAAVTENDVVTIMGAWTK